MTEPLSSLHFLAGGGEMGALIRAHDWAATPLGPPASWPQGLKTTVRLLLSTGHPMFIWWGPELIQLYNDAYRRSIGPERHPSALGQRGRECWEEIWPIIGPQIEQVMAGRGHTWHENQLVPITRHGRREDVYWTYSYGPIDEPSAPHGVGGVLVVCTETTDQVQSEQRLKAAEARWRAHFEQAPGVVCILEGPRHVFRFANDRYLALVGGRQVLGKTVREALPEVESQGFFELLDRVYRTGETHTGAAAPLLLETKSGGSQRRYVDFAYQPIRDEAGAVTGILVNGYDVTERVTTSEQLRAEHARKDEFLAMLAHELRNPLAAIANAGELLRRPDLPDPSRAVAGEILGRQVQQLTRLVDDLLDVSRITRGRIELQRGVFELGDAVARAIESVQPLMQARGHELVFLRNPTPIHVDGDRARIVQCVTNVLSNAAKYTADGGRIEVAVSAEEDDAFVRVTDDGIGLAPEMLPRVFDLFMQVERTLDRAEGGLGIGLSVVRQLVRMHGGEVSCASEGAGRGATFTIRLPATTAAPAADAREAQAPTGSRRVLVVDDNADAADSLGRLLRLEGHEVEVVYSAPDALERARTSAPELVLMDLGLPGVDGYEAARRLRASGWRGALVAVSGYGRPEDVRRATEAGFDAHLTKPVGIGALLERVRTLGASPGEAPPRRARGSAEP